MNKSVQDCCCQRCICSSCFLSVSGHCPHGTCFDDFRAINFPYDEAHPSEPPRKSWPNWATEQVFWCRGGVFYPAEHCNHYIPHNYRKLQGYPRANIIAKHKGYQLIERYERQYIRFWGGRDSNMPCEFPISSDDAKRASANPVVIEELVSHAKTQIPWTAESFFRLGITEYLTHHMSFTQDRVKKTYENLSRHPDIRNEFYLYVLEGKFPTGLLAVEGFTAEHLTNNYPFSPLGAYNYLIYLREMPQQALAFLQTGLPSKDSAYLNLT